MNSFRKIKAEDNTSLESTDTFEQVFRNEFISFIFARTLKIRMMKKTLLLTLSLLYCTTSFAKIDLTSADDMFKKAENYQSCEKELQKQLTLADNNTEKCEVLWRLARVNLLIGEDKTSKEEKRPFYTKGKEYATEAIKADSGNPNGYMWHSANIGRESQTKSLKDQIAIVSVVTEDLSMILDKLGATEMSEAWQAMSEMYFKHPFKSNDAAINFGRKAAMTIPSDEIRLATYIYFAEILYDRNNSASKRKSEIDNNVAEFKKTYKTNIDKYCFFEGSLGSSYIPKWSSKSLGSISDREEALDIVNYAMNLYQKKEAKTPRDNSDYRILVSYKEKWK